MTVPLLQKLNNDRQFFQGCLPDFHFDTLLP